MGNHVGFRPDADDPVGRDPGAGRGHAPPAVDDVHAGGAQLLLVAGRLLPSAGWRPRGLVRLPPVGAAVAVEDDAQY